MQPLQPEGFQQWSWKCWLWYSKCHISATAALRTLRTGTLTATWMFSNISEFQVKSHCFYHLHHSPSQLKPHLKPMSFNSAFASTCCQRKCTKISEILRFAPTFLHKMLGRTLALVTSLCQNQVHMYCCRSFFMSLLGARSSLTAVQELERVQWRNNQTNHAGPNE